MATTKVTSGVRTLATNEVLTANITNANVTTAKIADNAVTLAKMAGLTRGKIIYGNSSGDPTALTVGSADQVLTSDGTDISWAAPAGSFEFVETQSVSASNTITFAHTVAAGWDYIVNCRNVKNSGDVTVANAPKIQLGTGGGPTFSTSGYTNQSTRSTSTSIAGVRDGITNGVNLLPGDATTGGTAAGETWSSEATILNPGANSETDILYQSMTDGVDGLLIMCTGVGRRTTAEVVTGIRVNVATVTMTSGEFTLFRRKLS
jgi:hypothetical protein